MSATGREGRRADGEAGLTLVELMVVLVIFGILATSAVASIKTDKVGDGARRLQSLIHEARRQAVAGGPVRADVAVANGSRARARLELWNERGWSFVRLSRLVEGTDPGTSSWVELDTVHLPKDAVINSVALGTAGAVALTESAQLSSFYPDGRNDGLMVYLENSKVPDQKRSLRVLPLSALPDVAHGW